MNKQELYKKIEGIKTYNNEMGYRNGADVLDDVKEIVIDYCTEDKEQEELKSLRMINAELEVKCEAYSKILSNSNFKSIVNSKGIEEQLKKIDILEDVIERIYNIECVTNGMSLTFDKIINKER